MSFAIPALQIAAGLPILVALRFTVRGILIARGKTRAITIWNIILLALMSLAIVLRLLPDPENGAFNAYALWIVFLCLEVATLSSVAFRGGWGGQREPPVRPAREALIG
jgi:Na+-driven multidrug efflux pump